ncbi:MAG: Mur ligase domain-containing protein, partial [Nocardioides sp.]
MASDTDGDRPVTPPPSPTRSLAEMLGLLRAERLAVEGRGDLGTSIGGVTLDSRRVAAGDLYAALPGTHGHGAAYWPQ